MADRPYIFVELTNSLCSTCLRKVKAKVIFQEGRVYLLKHCPEHEYEKVLISTDVVYYQFARRALKPGTMPRKFNTVIEHGCPDDCGLCPDHEQHSYLALVEITDHCNQTCPICHAESSPQRPFHRSLEQIAFMLDYVVRNEGRPDVVQISGGEPTIHPKFFIVLDLAREQPIKHLMVNTNGVRIGHDLDFARRLADYKPNFEVDLQFDLQNAAQQQALRGANLVEFRIQALEHLNEHRSSTTLVVTLKKGLNDDQIGAILDTTSTSARSKNRAFTSSTRTAGSSPLIPITCSTATRPRCGCPRCARPWQWSRSGESHRSPATVVRSPP